MKTKIIELISAAARNACASGALPSDTFPDVTVEEPKAGAHGDFATNFAMLSAKEQKMAPRKIAQAVVDHLDDTTGLLDRVEIAGPGFINFFIRAGAWAPLVDQVLRQDRDFGACDVGHGRKIQVEFVSANPTGPLHVGHGRGAAVGDSVANILAFCGWDVQREYYINDSGRQIGTLGLSVYLRGRQLLGESVAFPEDCYQGRLYQRTGPGSDCRPRRRFLCCGSGHRREPLRPPRSRFYYCRYSTGPGEFWGPL